MEQRRKLRDQVEAQKKTIMEKFEQVKKQGSGNLSTQDLSALLNVSTSPVPATASPVKLPAVTPSPPKPNTQPAKPKSTKSSSISPMRQRPSPAKPDAKSAEQIGREKLNELRKKQNEELLNVLDEEQKKEEEREQRLTAASDQDKAKLEKGFGLERAKASKRVVGLSE